MMLLGGGPSTQDFGNSKIQVIFPLPQTTQTTPTKSGNETRVCGGGRRLEFQHTGGWQIAVVHRSELWDYQGSSIERLPQGNNLNLEA